MRHIEIVHSAGVGPTAVRFQTNRAAIEIPLLHEGKFYSPFGSRGSIYNAINIIPEEELSTFLQTGRALPADEAWARFVQGKLPELLSEGTRIKKFNELRKIFMKTVIFQSRDFFSGAEKGGAIGMAAAKRNAIAGIMNLGTGGLTLNQAQFDIFARNAAKAGLIEYAAPQQMAKGRFVLSSMLLQTI